MRLANLLLSIIALTMWFCTLVIAETNPNPTLTERVSTEEKLTNTQWRLVSFSKAGTESPVTKGSQITLKFEAGGRVGGSGGCNSYGADYQVRDDEPSFSKIISTKKACADEGAMQQETQYFQALESADKVELADNRLTIFYDDGRSALNFVNAFQESTLGKVHFPTSVQSEEAQAHFLRGVAALHSFWYPVALDEFRKSTTIEPNFVMGYWGEAMAHNHPLWGDPQETAAARTVLAKVTDTTQLTPREQAYWRAVTVLYGDGDKAARDDAYAEAMEKIYHTYSDDVEAALFYALALMGSIQPEDSAALQTRLRAGEIASAVYRKHPNHPGAAHYVIHAYDDPQHASKALDAARRYAKIAPAAPHALHMPSHIFLQLGMWPEAATSNEAAWAASQQWIERKNLPISKRDYHSLHWLFYVYLQQGRYTAAEDLLKVMQQSLAEGPTDDQFFMGYGTFTYASMAAAFVIETQRWNLADTVFKPLQNSPALTTMTSSPGPYQALAQYAQALEIFTRGLAQAHQDALDVQPSIDQLRKLEQRVGKGTLPGAGLPLVKVLEIQRLEIAAVTSAAQGDQTGAITLMEKTTALVEQTPPPSGPPPLIKPPHELFGQILLRTGQSHKAEEQFVTALRRHPNRARSLLGVARTNVQTRDTQAAAKAYSQFLRQWQPADKQLAELREAQTYGQQVSAR